MSDRRWTLMLLAAVAAAGCAQPSRESGDAPARTNDTSSSPAGARDAGWTVNGRLALPAEVATTAARVEAIERTPVAGTERITIAFADAAAGRVRAPAPVRAELLASQGLVRVWLPATVQEAAATDARFDSGLARAVYVVRALDRSGLFVDVHLAAPARARLERDAGGRLAVVLSPAAGEAAPAAPRATRVVVLAPRGGQVTGALEVAGYSRTFEANVVAELRRDGRAVSDTFTTAADWVGTWGEFRAVLPQAPAGPAELFVGEYSAKDGTPDGVVIPVNVAP